jgi:hypothetical protein
MRQKILLGVYDVASNAAKKTQIGLLGYKGNKNKKLEVLSRARFLSLFIRGERNVNL